jgi:hypothetical protein
MLFSTLSTFLPVNPFCVSADMGALTLMLPDQQELEELQTRVKTHEHTQGK